MSHESTCPHCGNALPSLIAAYRERDELRRQVENIRTMAHDCNGQQIVEALTGKDMMGPALRLSVILDAIAATESKGRHENV